LGCFRSKGSGLGRFAPWGDAVSIETKIGKFLDTRGLTQECVECKIVN